jgi:lysophospholipase L1-like esterase
MANNFPTQTLLAAASFAAILLGVHYGLDRTKGLDPSTALRPIGKFPSGRASYVPVIKAPTPPVSPTLAIPDPMAHGLSAKDAANATLQSDFLIDDSGALDHFYSALQNLSTGQNKRTVRIIHYGDSPTTADLITGDARELLQQRFGNAGLGFVLVAKPWAWYGHHGVQLDDGTWKINTAVDSMREANYGLGGAFFTGPVGSSSTIQLTGRDSSSMEIDYLAQPNGGSLDVLADGSHIDTVQTAATIKENAAKSIVLPKGTRKVELRVSEGAVELFGAVFSRDVVGITYDSIGLNGASTTVMSRAFNPATFAASLQHRNPDLVVINYGTNESSFPVYVEKQYEAELTRAVSRVRSALPNASILIMSPMDRGERSGDQISTMPAIPEIVAIQQRVARQTGCGFYNTYQAMGGSGTMARWYERQPAMVGADLIHPSPQGARIVAQLLVGQLLIGYERYMQNHQSPKESTLQNRKTNVPASSPVATPNQNTTPNPIDKPSQPMGTQ